MRSNGKRKLYFAAPLSTDEDRQFNKDVVTQLRTFFDVYLPQDDGGLMIDMIAKGMKPQEAAKSVFNIDVESLNRCDALLIVIHGKVVDEGAAFELGYAYAMGKPCFGLQTEQNCLLCTDNNPMIYCSLLEIFKDTNELISWANRVSISSSTDFSQPMVANTMCRE